MRRIVHLSDLHFGRHTPALETPLVEAVNGIAPDLVVISGDFTQRARRSQYRRARDFLDRLEPPWLAIPGNHDTPLDNLPMRLIAPWVRYRLWIDHRLEPVVEDDEMVVVGVNTVNRWSWQRGRISERTLSRVTSSFSDAGDRLRVAVLHHPLEHGPDVEKRLMRGARQALARLEGCGVDVVLSGHLHHTVTRPFEAAPGLLFVQAGTGLSDRRRGEANTFNLLRAEGDRIDVQTYAADAPGEGFAPVGRSRFQRDGAHWSRG